MSPSAPLNVILLTFNEWIKKQGHFLNSFFLLSLVTSPQSISPSMPV